MTATAMVMTAGGSPAPIRAALTEGRPDFVLFVVSHGSRGQVESEVLPQFPHQFQWEYLVITDHQDIGTCYYEIRRGLIDWLGRRALTDADVVVDITGGTKAMSAALALAGVERLSNFRYVGGTKRDADNLGVVVTGSERIIGCRNPWNKYAIRELERASRLLDDSYADSAASVLGQAIGRCDDSVQVRLRPLSDLVSALAASDRFDFKKAISKFNPLRKALEQILSWDLWQELLALHEHWSKVREQTKYSSITPRRDTILELIANADRRAIQSRYDDGVGRLYRAVELYAQGLARQSFGAELGKVPFESLPKDRNAEIRREFGKPREGIYELGTKKLFEMLRYDDNVPDDIIGIYTRLRKHLHARNNSLYAHGSVPVTKKQFLEFREAIRVELSIADSEIPTWPDISSALSEL